MSNLMMRLSPGVSDAVPVRIVSSASNGRSLVAVRTDVEVAKVWSL